MQWSIFRTVWLHEAARGLTIVGDPKQAIYGFRGADVATYERARATSSSARVRLARRPRRQPPFSTPALVEAVNSHPDRQIP